MKFLQKLLTIFVILVFSRFNFSVPYFLSNTLILNIKLSSCNESKNDSNNLQRNANSHILSQESSTNTHHGENNFINRDHKDSTTNNVVKTVPKSGINLDPNLDLGFPKNTDHYSSLCFSDDLELGEPLQLIYPNQDHTQLLLNEETLKHLENIPKPIYTVGIIGSVNAGKSTLLNLLNDNHLCNNILKRKKSDYHPKDDDQFERGARKSKGHSGNKDSKGFKVACSPEPETYGIWMYSQPVRMSRRVLEKKLQNSLQSLDSSYNSLKNLNDSVDNQFSKVVRVSSSGVAKTDEDDSDQDVNVVFMDIEGFSSHRNVFKYDEAIFSMASSICSEIIYLTNKTLNSSDLQLVEELIKSSLLSKISNLYTLYTNLGDFSEDREEIFQYFLRMFENKNITFLINEFNFTSEQAFGHLVNLLNGPKRDLSLHELFMYHSKKKKPDQKDYDYARAGKLNKQEELAKENTHKHRNEAATSQSEPSKSANKDDGVIDLIYQDSERAKPAKAGRSGSEMENLMFNSQGYIFHMLFNTVNMATLPTTPKNSLLNIMMDPTKDNKQSKKNQHLDAEYVEHLSRFKLELFQRSTRNALVKYCVVDGVNSVCNMSGRDVAEMVKFTLTSLSLNKFYKLATNVGSIEGMAKLDYKDAFDEYFRVFRSTRLLMIKNDLYETYKNILNSYINSSVSRPKEHKSGNESAEVVPMNKMPTIAMLKKQSQVLKGQLLDLMVKNYENEATSDDFTKIKTDLTQGFDRVAQLVELELFNKLNNYCTEASEKLLEAYQRNIDNLELPMLPSKLKFLHDLPQNFRKQYSVVVDGVGPEEHDYGFESEGTSSRAISHNHDLLSQSEPCDQVFEHYLALLDQKISELIKKNEDMIDKHFHQILTRALNHFKTKFIEAERNYEIPLEEALKLTSGVIKESHNIMVTHLGEFHAMEYLVNEYKSRLRQHLSQETEHFKRIYTSRCLQKFEDMQAHYLGNYESFLDKYTHMPANPEMLVKYHEFIRYLAKSEFYKSSCIGYVEIEKKHNRFEAKLRSKFKQIMGENVRLVSEALRPHFDKIDEYLLGKMDSCSVFTYFRYNAKRYAKFKITHKLIFTTLNLTHGSPNPDEVLVVERVLFNSANALPTANSELRTASFSSHSSIASSYDIDMKELNRKFITLNLVKVHKAFVNRVVSRYMEQHMPRFKKMFRQRYCNLLVLACSIVLLGMSTLSFMLAENGYSKLAFSVLGFVSYTLLVGVEATKKTIRKLQEILKNLSKRFLSHLFKLMLVVLNKLAILMGVAATFVFMRIGFLYTFMFGFFSALFLYVYYKVRRFVRRHRHSHSKK